MKIEMDEEWRKRWVAALRSGKYKQTQGQLRLGSSPEYHSYCCLGVLCEISGLGHWQSASGGMFVDTQYNHSNAQLPFTLSKQLGLGPLQQEYLTRLNDVHVATFARIADIIEGVDTNEPL